MLLGCKGGFQSKYLCFLSSPTLQMPDNVPKNNFSDHVSLKPHQTQFLMLIFSLPTRWYPLLRGSTGCAWEKIYRNIEVLTVNLAT